MIRLACLLMVSLAVAGLGALPDKVCAVACCCPCDQGKTCCCVADTCLVDVLWHGRWTERAWVPSRCFQPKLIPCTPRIIDR